MLEITIPDIEAWDERIEEFVNIKGGTILLEHSLVAISKWETKWQKPFISSIEKTNEETLDYIRCMTLNEVDPNLYLYLNQFQLKEIEDYIDNPMTATTFYENPNAPSQNKNKVITAELIYYWMISYNIPVEKFEKWHFNKLLTLIRIFNVKNQSNGKMSTRDTMAQYRQLNAARKKKINTKG